MNRKPFSQESSTLLKKCTQYSAFMLIVLFLCVSYCNQTYADVTTYQWANNYRGYSIEKIPGSSPAEYVAVSTLISSASLHGLQFLHLDAYGNIISDKNIVPTISNPSVSIRAVDISVESSSAFWITLQARDYSASAGDDYIYAIRVDASGTITGSPDHISIKPGGAQLDYTKLYATHSLYFNNALYICGYAADGLGYGQDPDKWVTPKKGIVIKADVSSVTPVITNYCWDTPPNTNYDYDMPLSMVIGTDLTDDLLFITGAMNACCERSGILALKIDLNLSSATTNGLYDLGGPVVPIGGPASGYYGVDIIRANDNATDNVYILTNHYRDHWIQSWGVCGFFEHISPSISFPYPPPVWAYPINYFFSITPKNNAEWGNQIFHGDNSRNFMIFGQRVADYGCGNTVTPAPSYSNVNPFVACYNFSTLGTGLSGTRYAYNMQLSNNQTSPSSIDYYLGTSAGALEDVSRLYSSATFDGSNIAVLSPMADNTNTNLNAKFDLLTAAGHEQMCSNEFADCDPGYVNLRLDETNPFTVSGYALDQGAQIYLGSANSNVTVGDCNGGNYKTGATTITSLRDININITTFPNPVKDVLHLQFSHSISSLDDFSFVLINTTGEIVYTGAKPIESTSNITMHLPKLSSGIYFGRIMLNGKEEIKKITVE